MNISAQLPDKPDQGLLRAIGSRSFPTCVIMDTDGKVILRNDTAGAFRPNTEKRLRTSLEVVQELLDLRSAVKADPEDSGSQASLKVVESILEVRSTPLAQLDRLIEEPGVSKQLTQRYRRWRAVKPVTQLLQDYVAKIRKIPRSDTAARTSEFHLAAGKMLEIYRQGLVLDDPRAGIFSDYWRLVFEGAMQAKDVEVAARALTVYRQSFGSRPDLKNRIDLMAKRLGSLRKSQEQSGPDEKQGESR